MERSGFIRKIRSAIPVSTSLGNATAANDGEKGFNAKRLLFLSLQAVVNAVLIGFIAKGLVALISLITNLAFYGRISFE
ncbi:MAG: hypothetical protein K8F30_02030, partial [Taibaiella sp.]|nr:hypothetical protein [Taibaiella sp.]